MNTTTQVALQTTGIEPLVEASPARLLSLDVFRGLTVLTMVLVNHPGDWGHIYEPLEHAKWNGCTIADLVFPFFLFIVGVSAVYALDRSRQDPALRPAALRGVWRRALLLVGVGILVALLPYFDFGAVRLPGVLQRIGLVFGVCGTLFLYTSRRQQLWLVAVLLIGYNILMQLVPVPGYGPANLEPETNLGAWLDRLIFTEKHLWQYSRTWDPEGLLGTLPAVGTGLLGVLAGQWLRRKEVEPAAKVAWLFVDAVLLTALGLLWNLWFPINKALWTSSFVLFVGGLALALLATLYWLCDLQGWRRGLAWAQVAGVNALLVFVGSTLVARTLNMWTVTGPTGTPVGMQEWLYGRFFVPYFASPYVASLAGAVVCVAIWYGVLWVLYRRRIVVKL
ncbi:heparan-alpha-glucosaminide N-acetyltransferase domain-containing protein [Hymenobacter sp. J193]|uniref:acyltransferase family protein n=1 Tax=Hymenobacter sp. J193 TaxID=2898429 RepID=UPI002151859A|nr:heparan-alpha-glucosaminide N-acetyltransferase domain-containing protein [Hymenobacter sp. J193]MCR5889076.1 heparan-alpha-glucosaminide N-acetyltransferase domain-containing protein [Hymenobacter sp. J193]